MIKKFKAIITGIIRVRYDSSFDFEDDEFEEVIEQVMNHLLVHNIFFLKDIKWGEFIEILWQYVSIKRNFL
ncbi:MAG: hypothetical protein MJA82_12255 [Clostridia bacterium]|nr:hypothetical protein [Clostridia bacterium]